MKMIIGLGNPGPQYARTRHNVGFLVVDRLAARHAPAAPARGRFNAITVEGTIPTPAGGEKCLFLKPTTFMNRSGQAIGEAIRFYKLDLGRDVLIVVDDVYLPVGTIRIRPGGGAGGHNGLADIERALGTDAYPRLRIGVNAKPPHMDQADYVLSRFTEEEETLLAPALDRAVQACEAFASRGLDAAMNVYNADPAPKPPRPARPAPPSPEASNPPTPAAGPVAPPRSPRPPETPANP